MTYEKRLYSGPEDLRAMQDLTQKAWSLNARTHIGDLAWGRFSHAGRETDWPTLLCENKAELVGWAWAHLPGTLRFMTKDPDVALASDMLFWFKETATANFLDVEVLDGESHLIEALEASGFVEAADEPWALHMVCDLATIEAAALPPGFTARNMNSGVSLGSRAKAHADAWTILPFIFDGQERNLEVTSRVTEETYKVLVKTWPWRPELDWVIEAPDGTLAACCILWLDEESGVAELEPVGTHPDYRKLGLGAAVCLWAMNAAKELGATRAIVYPRGDDAYPVPQKLYRKIGFEPYGRTRIFRTER
jgi:GNAT superfamily N-acetyltransferase